MNAKVPFFRQPKSIAELATIVKVFKKAKFVGIYIVRIINSKVREGEIFSKNFINLARFLSNIKTKHPVAISQNLEGIRK